MNQRPLLVPVLLAVTGLTVTSSVRAEEVIWQNGRGVVISGASITKSGNAGWGNGGASSGQAILSGDGVLEFTTNEATTDKVCGLARRDRDQQYESIDFAFWLSGGGAVAIVERGVLMGWFGTYAAGDRLQVTVKGKTVRYRMNGTLLYTSSVEPSFPLLADA